jgi:hypothetical protein
MMARERQAIVRSLREPFSVIPTGAERSEA